MRIKKYLASFLTAMSLLSISAVSYAEDIVFSNQSKYNLSLSRSDQFPTVTLHAGFALTFDECIFKLLCQDQVHHCNFYITKEGSSNETAIITFSDRTIVAIDNHLNDIAIHASGSSVEFTS